MNAKFVGFIRMIGGIALFAAAEAVLQYLSVAVHLQTLGLTPVVAASIAGIFGLIEAQIEATSGKALFGAAVSV